MRTHTQTPRVCLVVQEASGGAGPCREGPGRGAREAERAAPLLAAVHHQYEPTTTTSSHNHHHQSWSTHSYVATYHLTCVSLACRTERSLA